MHWRGSHVCAISLLLAAPLLASHASAEPTWPPPAPVTTTLANGLRVVVAEDHRLPIVGMTLRYGVGAAAEPTGLAARFAAALLRESRHVGKDAYERYVLDAGGGAARWNAGRDGTRFYVSVPASQAVLPLWLWSDQMAFPEHAIRAVIAAPTGLVEQRRARGVDDVPYGALLDLVNEHLYPSGHPYAHSSVYGLRSGALPSAEEVSAFHAHWFGPQNATLAVVGDVDPVQINAQIEKYFGPIPRRATPVTGPLPPAPASAVRLEVAARVPAVRVAVDWLVPAAAVPDRTLEILEESLGGGSTRALQWELVERLGLATKTSATYRDRELGSIFEVTADVAPKHTADEVLAALDVILGAQLATLLGESTIERATTARGNEHRRELETMVGRSQFLAAQPRGVAIEGLSFTGTYSWIHAQEVVKAARAHLGGASRRVTTVFTPDPAAPLAGVLRSKRSVGGTP